MRYGILGDLEVRGPDGALVGLPRGHTLAVLAALLMRPNRGLSTADLLAAAWGGTEVGPAQLHKSISALRKLFDGGTIKTYNRFGYGVSIAPDDLDLLVFHRLVEEAEADRAARRAADEITRLREALALWRGSHPLANVRFGAPGAFAREIEALRGRRKRCAVRLFACEIERGEPAAVLDDLERFAAEYPADAQLCRLRMIALYQAGHAEDATAAYERFEREGDADKALRHLAYAMSLRNDRAVARAAGVGFPERSAPLPRQLPAGPAYLVGRDDLLAEVSGLLCRPRDRVVVICGPGGMGKTALALRAAHDAAGAYPDGQLWADLRGTTAQPADPAEVLAEFLRALGERGVPETARERAGLFRSLLADRRLLVVLDDAADDAQIRDLLPGDGDTTVLVTARRRLPGIEAPSHQVAPLGALAPAAASALFRRIVTAGNVDLTGEDEAVESVVRLCGGLPLALRIAALMRVDDFHRPTAELLRRLAEQGPDAFEHGHESLARTLAAGLAPLDDRARRLFVGLGRLTLPTFGEWTAAALLDEPGPAAGAALAQLAAVGMAEPAPGGGRYRFHDLTREYARGRATAAGEDLAAPARVCRALLTLTRRAHASLYGGQFDVVHTDLPDVAVPAAALAAASDAPRAWFEAERLNIRAAVEQAAALGLAGLCWDLAVSAHEFYALGQYFDDWRATHEVALAAARAAGDPRGTAMVLTALGQPPLVVSGTPGVSGVPELETAVRLLTEAGERHGLAMAQRTLANALRRRGELLRPLALFTGALASYRACGDVVGVQQTLRFLGQNHLDLGDAAAAVAFLLEAEQVARRLGSPRVLAPTLYWMGHAHLARGDLPAAATAFDEVLAAYPPSSGVGHAYARHGLGALAIARADFPAAADHLEQADALAAGADAVLAGRIQLALAALEKARDRPADQIVALLRAIARFRTCGAIYQETAAQAALADAYARSGDHEAADAARDRVNEVYDTAGVPDADRRHA